MIDKALKFITEDQPQQRGRLFTAPLRLVSPNQTGSTKNQLAQSINAAPAARVR